MDEPELKRKLLDVFVQVFSLSPDAVNEDLRPEDVPQWDSIGHVRLVAALEETFAYAFDIDEIIALTSFGAIFEVLAKRFRPS